MPNFESSRRANAGLGVDAMTRAIVGSYLHRGKSLRKDDANKSIVLIQQLYRAEAMKGLINPVEKALIEYAERVADTADTIYRRIYGMRSAQKAPEDHHLPPSIHRGIWESAMEQEARQSGLTNLLNIQSMHSDVSERVYVSVAEVLQSDVRSSMLSEVAARSSSHTPLIRGIMETTKKGIRALVDRMVTAGKSFSDTVKAVKAKAKEIAGGRAGTIARTEAVRATSIGVTMATKHSWEITHISVVGCTMVEWRGPCFYRGLPTCNIQNVPAKDGDSLEFHPNHTGFIEIAGTLNADGSYPNLILAAGH
jgi:hypothetical protein